MIPFKNSCFIGVDRADDTPMLWVMLCYGFISIKPLRRVHNGKWTVGKSKMILLWQLLDWC